MPKSKEPNPAATVVADAKAGILRVAGMPDRVWVSSSIKIQLVKYEITGEASMGYSTDAQPGETPKVTFARCWKVVEAELRAKTNELMAVKAKYNNQQTY